MNKFIYNTSKRISINGVEIPVFVPTGKPEHTLNPICIKRIFAGVSFGGVLLLMGMIALSFC